jgi:hypothetical protein
VATTSDTASDSDPDSVPPPAPTGIPTPNTADPTVDTAIFEDQAAATDGESMTEDDGEEFQRVVGRGRKRKEKRRQQRNSREAAAAASETDTGKEEAADSDSSPQPRRQRVVGGQSAHNTAAHQPAATPAITHTAAALPVAPTQSTPSAPANCPLIATPAIVTVAATPAIPATLPLSAAAPRAASQSPTTIPQTSAPAPAAARRQQQQQQRRGDSRQQPRTKATAPPLGLIARCGTPVVSETSLVLTLTPTAAHPAGTAAAWSRLPRPSDKDSRSMVAVARLLTSLRIPLPHLPRLYNRCNTPAELADRLRQRSPGVTHSGIDWDKDIGGVADDGSLGLLLVSRADAIAAETADTAKLTQWAELLTPHSGCMSSRPASQPATAAGRSADSRCVLRLDFASPLVCRAVGAYLYHQASHAATPSTAPPNTQQPPVTWTVQHYRRRLIAARVSGFAIGPLNHDPVSRFTSLTEPHGNWQVLRQWLASAAPHCAPSNTPVTLSSGVGAVDFVLEETHQGELYALNGTTAPDSGITRPLRLHVSILRQSPNTACSICGEAKHRARDCPSKPLDGLRTCKVCFGHGHTAQDCTVQAGQRVCKLCNEHGHSTLQCSKYRPRWVDIVPADRKGGRDGKDSGERSLTPPAPRNTFAAERIALLQGKQFVQPATPAILRPAPAGTQPMTANYQPAGNNTARQSAWTTWAQPVQQNVRQTTLEQQMVQMNARMEEMQRTMARQMEWMQQVILRLLGSSASPEVLLSLKEMPNGFPGQPYNISPLGSQAALATTTTAAPMQVAEPSVGATAAAPQWSTSSGSNQAGPPVGITANSAYPAHSPLTTGAPTASHMAAAPHSHYEAGGYMSWNHNTFTAPVHVRAYAPHPTAPAQDGGHPTGHSQHQHHPPAYGIQTAPTSVAPNEQ